MSTATEHEMVAHVAALIGQAAEDAPTQAAVDIATMLVRRAFAIGLPPVRVLASAEGGVFIVWAHGNIEVFNDRQVFAAAHLDALYVWPLPLDRVGKIDAAIKRVQ